MTQKLLEKGLCQNKSFKITFPSYLEENLIKHFIRGYFDGDGCVSVSKRNDIEIKILGTESFLNELNQYINFSCVRYKKGIYEIRKGGVNNALRFYKYIYQDATIYLKRKYKKYKEVIERKHEDIIYSHSDNNIDC